MSSSIRLESLASRRATRRRRARSQLGVVMVEYSLLLIAVAIPTIIGFTAAGVGMLHAYRHNRDHLMLPTP